MAQNAGSAALLAWRSSHKRACLRSYEGTIFRLPLRDAARAKASRIVGDQHWCGVADVRAVLADFARACPSWLLFLRHVESISVHRRAADGTVASPWRSSADARTSNIPQTPRGEGRQCSN